MQITTITYHGQPLEAVEMGGEIWLTLRQLVSPLGYSTHSGLQKIYERNLDEFGPEETRLVALPTETRGDVEQRVFSLRGARLLALLAKTEPAKEFRRWVLDLLQGRVLRQPIAALKEREARIPLSTDARLALAAASELIEPDHPAQATLRDYMAGTRILPSDPRLQSYAEAWERATELLKMGSREQSRIVRMAMLDGWSRGAIQAEVRRQRLMRQPQLAMALDEENPGLEAIAAAVAADESGVQDVEEAADV